MRNMFLIGLGLVALAGCKKDQPSPAADSAAMTPPPAADTTAMSPALDDPTIVSIFDAANTFDIEASQLALEKSQNADVRKLAQQFVNDHTTVRQQGRDLAAKLGVTPPTLGDGPLSQGHAAAMANLRTLSGAEFDKAYVANEVTYHATVIQAVQNDLMPAIQNAELRALVEKVAPAFQAHHDAAQALQAKLGN
jgi:putative membrane protein